MGLFPIRKGKTGQWPLVRAQGDRALLLKKKKKSSFLKFHFSLCVSLCLPLFSFSWLFSGGSSSTTKSMATNSARVQTPLWMFTHSCNSFLPNHIAKCSRDNKHFLLFIPKESMETFFHHFLAWWERMLLTSCHFYWWDYSVKTEGQLVCFTDKRMKALACK